jgi:hypothetical protein
MQLPYNKTTSQVQQILINTANIRLLIEDIIREEQYEKQAKHFINEVLRKVKSIESDFRSSVSIEQSMIIRKGISENDNVTIHENLRYALLQLNDAQLENVEQYIDALINEKYRMPDFIDLNDLTKALNDTMGVSDEKERLKVLNDLGFDIVRVKELDSI